MVVSGPPRQRGPRPAAASVRVRVGMGAEHARLCICAANCASDRLGLPAATPLTSPNADKQCHTLVYQRVGDIRAGLGPGLG